MKLFRILVTLSIAFLSSLATVSFAAGDSAYRLGSGDVISINVFGEQDLSFDKIRLTDAGTLSFPFLGEVRANGKTAIELEEIIVTGLKGDYLIDPKVSVSVLEYREFFISGEVKSPGGYPFKPGLNLQKAITLAGGLTDRASERKMFIVRDGESEADATRADMNTPVMPGDMIKIEESFF